MRTLLLLTLLAGVLSVEAPSCNAATGCGLLPLKPLIPLGCKDLTPVCTCDEKGKNCKWLWQCVKR